MRKSQFERLKLNWYINESILCVCVYYLHYMISYLHLLFAYLLCSLRTFPIFSVFFQLCLYIEMVIMSSSLLSSKAKGFGVGLKAMKDVKADELADAINQCTVVTDWW